MTNPRMPNRSFSIGRAYGHHTGKRLAILQFVRNGKKKIRAAHARRNNKYEKTCYRPNRLNLFIWTAAARGRSIIFYEKLRTKIVLSPSRRDSFVGPFFGWQSAVVGPRPFQSKERRFSTAEYNKRRSGKRRSLILAVR